MPLVLVVLSWFTGSNAVWGGESRLRGAPTRAALPPWVTRGQQRGRGLRTTPEGVTLAPWQIKIF